jgi:hypothetical protein
VVATVNAAIAAAIAVLLAQAAEAPTAATVVAGAVAFLALWGALFLLQLSSFAVLRDVSSRFPTPSGES